MDHKTYITCRNTDLWFFMGLNNNCVDYKITNFALRGCTLMTSSETPPGGGTSKRWLLVTGGEGGSSQKVTSFINNRNIKGVHYKLLEMLYNYRKYQIITHFFILFGLKILKIVINNTVVANNSYFKFYISNFRV